MGLPHRLGGGFDWGLRREQTSDKACIHLIMLTPEVNLAKTIGRGVGRVCRIADVVEKQFARVPTLGSNKNLLHFKYRNIVPTDDLKLGQMANVASRIGNSTGQKSHLILLAAAQKWINMVSLKMADIDRAVDKLKCGAVTL